MSNTLCIEGCHRSQQLLQCCKSRLGNCKCRGYYKQLPPFPVESLYCTMIISSTLRIVAAVWDWFAHLCARLSFLVERLICAGADFFYTSPVAYDVGHSKSTDTDKRERGGKI